VLTGQGGGWRQGLGVLCTRGMAVWVAAWAALPLSPHVNDAAGTTAPAGSVPVRFDPVPDQPAERGGVEPACTAFPPVATSRIVAVLAQLTLAHARRTTDPRDCQEDRPP